MKKLMLTQVAALAAVLLSVLVLSAFGPARPAAAAAEPTDEQILVDQAQITLRNFQAEPEMKSFREALREAKGVLIVPDMYRAGLVFGGAGGKGVYLSRDEKTGAWMGPAFYNLGSFNFGLQMGGQVAEVVILAMTDEADQAMMSPQFRLGGDLSVATGPVGIGVAGSASLPPAAFVSFARAKGAYVGITLEGTVINVDEGSNAIYYGRQVTPEAILMTGEAVSPNAAGLREAVERAFKCC